MENNTFSDDLRRYLALALQWAWLLILVTLLSGIVAYVINRRTIPVYQASTTLYINQAPSSQSTDYSSLLTSERLAQTYAQLITKQPILEGVIKKLGLSRSVDSLKPSISVKPVNDTQLIVVSVTSINPQQAAEIANAVVEEFRVQNLLLQSSRYASSKDSLQNQLAQLDQQMKDITDQIAALGTDPSSQAERDRLQTNLTQYRQAYAYLLQSFEQVRLAEAQTTSNVVQVEAATPPKSPIRPRVMVNTLLAMLVGFMVAVGGILLVEALDDTLRNPEDITRELNLPVLGLIAHVGNGKETGPVVATQPRSPVAEAYRLLRTNIQYASVDHPINTLVVTSPMPSDGKSTIAANLAIVVGQSNRQVSIVDTDLRRPTQHSIFHLTNRSGISELFVQPAINLPGELRKTEFANLQVLPSGGLPPNPSELLGSEKMEEILREFQKVSDFLILDTPPILAVTDACVLATKADGVLLVVRPGATKRAALRQSVEQLRRVGANLIGVVLNDVELKSSRYTYYKGYYYSYYHSYDDTKKPKTGWFGNTKSRRKHNQEEAAA